MSRLDIAEVARRTGLPASTLRYYEEKGLIVPAGRHGLRRQYDESVLERLALVALGREAGFSLDDILAMVGVDGRPAIDRAKLGDKADELDRTIRRLVAVRDALRHAAVCPAPSHLECPSFQKRLRIVAHRHPARRTKTERD
ncbi:helix-turn-helix domain-containing protein [Burkholderia sp. JKS000303]|uniref:helix-turn-helix domain-containing protein n=1 Tax=Burkholderia sp. JKS000303 TaxID=1938747 RepID=UPI000BF2CEFD|nr:helix-turn-helix domain-containing protein [Burkholderia sp. JKS000303]PFH30168.1 MerR family transcriptional regulator [Burkholderia sp. JKS000303]